MQWLAGLYYFDETQQIDSFNFDSFAPGDPQNGCAVQRQASRLWAAFGSLNYAVSSDLKLRGGIRCTNDRKDFVASRTTTPFGGEKFRPLSANQSGTNTSVDFGVSYNLGKNSSVFGRVATGYRPSSIQGRVLFGDTILMATPGKARSVEAGYKVDLMDNTLSVGATLFSYEVKDLQLTAGSGSVNQNRLVNAAKATGSGSSLFYRQSCRATCARRWPSASTTPRSRTAVCLLHHVAMPISSSCRPAPVARY